jgi:hypothetical protein
MAGEEGERRLRLTSNPEMDYDLVLPTSAWIACRGFTRLQWIGLEQQDQTSQHFAGYQDSGPARHSLCLLTLGGLDIMKLMRCVFALVAVVGSATLAPAAQAAPPRPGAEREVVHEVTLPAGTVLRVRVSRGFGSDVSRIEDPVQGTLVRPVLVGDTEALPAGWP